MIKKLLLFTSIALLIVPPTLFAQEKLSLTLTPPLFRLNLTPGESWASSLKLVNVNPYDITVYATTKDFTDQGGRGTPTFFPPAEDPDNTHSLGSWITAPDGPIVVPKSSTKDIPFSVHIPLGAEPGGHYGAIQVGTIPVNEKGASGVAVGSQVASLFFVRVSGAVSEEGEIRDFYPQSTIVGEATQTFTMKFENTGNVHLQPQGEIVITNMWGKERGKIAINKESNFGNVLPQSTREFEFLWAGEENMFDIGLYRAEVTIGFGEEARQTLFRKAYFWIIPWKPLVGTLGGLALLLLVGIWSLRRYVEQALDLERRRIGSNSPFPVRPSMRVIAAPLSRGIRDFDRIRADRAIAHGKTPLGLGEYLWRYRYIFLSLLALILLGAVSYIYFSNVLIPQRDFDAEITSEGSKSVTVIE